MLILGSLRLQPSPGYSWARSVAVASVQTLMVRLNHRFQGRIRSFMNQIILRLLHKLLTTYTLPDDHHRALFLSRTKPHCSPSGSTALSEWSVFWDSFVSKLCSIPTRISNMLGVTDQLSSRGRSGSLSGGRVFSQRQANKCCKVFWNTVESKDKDRDRERQR